MKSMVPCRCISAFLSSMAVAPIQRQRPPKKKERRHKESKRRRRAPSGREEEVPQAELEKLIELASCGGLDQDQLSSYSS